MVEARCLHRFTVESERDRFKMVVMMTLSRIVVGTDFSEHARRAIERSALLASVAEAELTVVHMYETAAPTTATILTGAELDERLQSSAEQELAQLTSSMGGARGLVVAGRDAANALCDAARELEADLVVVGTMGRTGVARFFVGSVAERVARSADRPVWVERPMTSSMRAVERVTVCTDLSDNSESALELAAGFARTHGAVVEVVYALDRRELELEEVNRRRTVMRIEEELAQRAAEHFEGIAPRLSVLQGANVVDAITAHAARTSSDVLVLATRGRAGASRLLMGSVAERVTRFAPCSVLITRRTDKVPGRTADE